MKDHISRRTFLKNSAITIGTVTEIGISGIGRAVTSQSGKARVFFTQDISSLGLMKVHSKISTMRKLQGRVAVKLHSGKLGGHNYPAPDLISGLLKAVNGVQYRLSYTSV